jgi:glutathione S-transferase
MPFEFRMLDAEHPEDGAELEKRWPLKRFPVLLDGKRLVAEASILVEYVNQRAPERADADSGRCRRRYRGALAPGRPLALSAFGDAGHGCHYFNLQGSGVHRERRGGTKPEGTGNFHQRTLQNGAGTRLARGGAIMDPR